MATKAPAIKATANVNPAVVLDRASKALHASVVGVEKIVADLQSLAATSAALALTIEDQNTESAQLAAANEATRRTAAAELRLQVKEDSDEVLVELLDANGLARITNSEVESLRAALAAKEAADDKELKTAVAIAVQAEKRDAQAAAAQVDATNKVNAAQKDAQISMQADKITFLSSQVTQLQAQIDADRQTRLEIAKAEAGRQGVVVNNGK